MVDDLEAIGLKVCDPLLAAAAVGVAMHIDAQGISRLRRRATEQCSQCGDTE
jgi:hypothetical protein